jgi:hypothetical protein
MFIVSRVGLQVSVLDSFCHFLCTYSLQYDVPYYNSTPQRRLNCTFIHGKVFPGSLQTIRLHEQSDW